MKRGKVMKRIFLIVADSMGVGAAPDADRYYNGNGNDSGSDTYGSLCRRGNFSAPFLTRMGIGNLDGMPAMRPRTHTPIGAYGRMQEMSAGKDTVTGHWEIAGLVSKEKMPTYPDGFPPELLDDISSMWGRGWLCNRPYSGTQVIRDYGREHMETGKLIVYTSADSVFQVAAHEDIIPIEDLYRYCALARKRLTGPHAVGRVIARPFVGEWPGFTRTSNRRDYALEPPSATLCDCIAGAGMEVIGIGKIGDIFAHRGITREIHTQGNADGMAKTMEIFQETFRGLCFVNLVDFDMQYGHRRDPAGYAGAVMELDRFLYKLFEMLGKEDCLVVTADHGCDPGYIGTDHTREYVPVLIAGPGIRSTSLGTRSCFGDLGKTCAEMLGVDALTLCGTSFLQSILKDGMQ